MRKMERLFQYGMKVGDNFEENCILPFILGSQLQEFRKESSKIKRKRPRRNKLGSFVFS